MIQTHEWDVWKYAQWIVQFYQGETVIKTNLIRVQRLLPVDQVATHVFFDVRLPDAPYDRCTMTLWNGGSTQTLLMDNLKVGCFKEQWWGDGVAAEDKKKTDPNPPVWTGLNEIIVIWSSLLHLV